MSVERIDHSKGVVELRLNRAEKQNALTQAMYAQLCEQLSAIAEAQEIRVVILSGAGKSFSAGNDITDFLYAASPLQIIARFLHTLVDFPKPLIAAVQGNTVGIGATLLLHCDLVIAADTLKCRMPFAALGVVPEGGSSWLLPQQLGTRHAFERLIEGRPFDAEEAVQMRLVNQVVPASDLEAATLARANAIAALPPEAVRLGKGLLRGQQRTRLHEVIDTEARQFAERLESEEAQKVLNAFLQS